MIEVTGTRELSQKLQRLLRNAQKRDRFLLREAEILKSRAKRKTPVDTGFLRNNWMSSGVTGGSVDVYNNTEYAAYVEFGHKTRGGGFVPGQYFLRDAVKETSEHFAQDLMRYLND